MYDKNTVTRFSNLIKDGVSCSEISSIIKVPLSTIYRWRNIRTISLKIDELIRDEKFDKALEMLMSVGDIRNLEFLYNFHMYRILVGKNRDDEALANARETLKKDPSDFRVASQLVITLMKQNRVSEAEAIVEGFLIDNADDDYIVNKIAKVYDRCKCLIPSDYDNRKVIRNIGYFLKDEDYAKAEKLARTGLLKYPEDKVIEGRLVDSLTKQGKVEEAINIASL